MAAKKSSPSRSDARDAKSPAEGPSHGFVVVRETIESIVVALALAFLFRTFEAEAFVIPTGSMSPSLLGQHKDVRCPKCGYRFRTTASTEGEDRDKLIARMLTERTQEQREHTQRQIRSLEVVGGTCPMCRYLMPMRTDLPITVADQVDLEDVEAQPSYPGDRILVNKYGYDFSDPERWDVVVFKFPGDGNMNYIKRLVGLPGETVRVYQGDVFIKPLEAPDSEFRIARKPADKAAAMLEVVHDSQYESSELHQAGWPLRWDATTPDGWKIEAEPGAQTVAQTMSVDVPADAPPAWLRYRHLPPEGDDWRLVRGLASDQALADLNAQNDEQLTRDEAKQVLRERAIPQLVADFNAYNARLLRSFAERDGWEIVPNSGQMNHAHAGSFGTEWVGDLALEVDLEVHEARGEVVLDLVEAGYHFRATIDLKSGAAALQIVDGRTGQPLPFKAKGDTSVKGPGKYQLRLANVDDQLYLWIDDEAVELEGAAYDPDQLFPGGREGMLPWRSDEPGGDQGDLAPAGVAARGAKLSVHRLRVLRDIYYIATTYPGDSYTIYDYQPWYAAATIGGKSYGRLASWVELFSDSNAWQRFATRHSRDFDVKPGQLFVMGDNSPESKDARLWLMSFDNDRPGGQYLDRQLLIGKAICVFWPHSWGEIPGAAWAPGWPNFGDMRLVR
jgi:signal peptidase I